MEVHLQTVFEAVNSVDCCMDSSFSLLFSHNHASGLGKNFLLWASGANCVWFILMQSQKLSHRYCALMTYHLLLQISSIKICFYISFILISLFLLALALHQFYPPAFNSRSYWHSHNFIWLTVYRSCQQTWMTTPCLIGIHSCNTCCASF
jgi:hypothetical protein